MSYKTQTTRFWLPLWARSDQRLEVFAMENVGFWISICKCKSVSRILLFSNQSRFRYKHMNVHANRLFSLPYKWSNYQFKDILHECLSKWQNPIQIEMEWNGHLLLLWFYVCVRMRVRVYDSCAFKIWTMQIVECM